MGGLSRKAYQIKEIQKEGSAPVVLLDSGSLLFAKPVIADSVLAAKQIQARGINRAMQKMNYDGIGVAPLDLASGLDFLTGQEDTYSLPLLSANILNPESGKPLFMPYRIKQVGDISLAFIGLTGNIPKSGGTQQKEYRIASWQNMVPGILDKIREHADMIILLSSYPESVNRQIADRFDTIHLILQSGHSSANKTPYLAGNTLIAQTGSRGKYMGRMDISWHKSRRWQQDIPIQLKQAREVLDRINWRLGRLTKRLQGQGLEQNSTYQTLLKEKDLAEAEVTRLEKLAEEQQGITSSFRNRFIPLRIALPEDKEVRDIVQQTKVEVNNAGRKKLSQLQQAAGSSGNPISASMTGWKKCQGCHPLQTAFWLKTRHSVAWQTLVNAKQQFNQDCIACHVTLPTYDMDTVHTQNLLAVLTPEFYGVSCEACHGPGRKHVDGPEKNSPLQPDADTCLNCHTPDHDDNFIYEQKVRLIRCPADSSTS